MFETGPVTFLQSFFSDWLTVAMVLITALGSGPFQTVIVGVVMLGINFRKGFYLAHITIWAALTTDFFKNLFQLPRPYEVDPLVRRPDLEFAETSESDGLFRAAYRKAVAVYGTDGVMSHGFPSGHVSATSTTWGGLSVMFHRRAVRVIGLVLLVLVAVSRIYLGRHFVADVLGGLVLGASILFLLALITRGEAFYHLDWLRLRLTAGVNTLVLVAYMLVVPIALLAFGTMVDSEDAGRLLGINAAVLLLSGRGGLPADSGPVRNRIARVLLGLMLMILTQQVFTGVVMKIFPDHIDSFKFVRGLLSYFVFIWVTVEAGKRVGLFPGGK